MSSNGSKAKRVGALSSRLFKSEKSMKNLFESFSSSKDGTKGEDAMDRELNRLGIRAVVKAKRIAHAAALRCISADDLGENHIRLLYLISSYAPPDTTRWIREQSTSVIIYEGIVNNVLDYDYAPKSEHVQGTLLFINVSQEGMDDLVDLREAGMLNMILLSTYQHNVTRAFQVSEEGMQRIQRWRATDPSNYAKGTAAVHSLIYKTKDGNLPDRLPAMMSKGDDNEILLKYQVMVDWDEDLETFFLSNEDGYFQASNITVVEDVTYVCSPYLPTCIRTGIKVSEMPKNNQGIAVRVTEAIKAANRSSNYTSNNIRDKLNEILKLNYVKVLVSEWLPYGRNHMANLITKLGAESRTQGGMFTTNVDSHPGSTVFNYDLKKVGNCIHVVDYSASAHINFIADITTPEEEGITQVEEFGVHVHFDGSVLYGLEVNSINIQLQVGVSVDKLSRLLVDVHQDSSFLTYSLTTAYQRVLMDTMSGGSSFNREKYNFIMADSIEPRLPAEQYMDSEDNQMELQQVIGNIRSAHDLRGGEFLLVIGSTGMILVGANRTAVENILIAYISLRSREMGMEQFVNRLFHVGDTLQELRQCVVTYHEDPGSLDRMTMLQSEMLHELINLQELLSQLIEGLDLQHSILRELDVPGITRADPVSSGTVQANPPAALPPITAYRHSPMAQKAAGVRDSFRARPSGASAAQDRDLDLEREIAQKLDVSGLYSSMRLRCSDMAIHLQGARAELESLRHMTSYITGQEAYKLQTQVQANTRNLEDVFRSNERSSSSLEIMQVILAGSLAFDILDRIFPFYMSITHGVHYQWMKDVVRFPTVWFFINISFWVGLSILLIMFMRYLSARAHGIFTVRMMLNIPVNIGGLGKMLADKMVQTEDISLDEKGFLRQCTYLDTSSVWHGHEVKIDLIYDEKSSHLLKAHLQVPKACGFGNVAEVQDAFFEDLVRKRALTAETVEQWRQNALDSEAKRDRKVEHMKKVNAAKSRRSNSYDYNATSKSMFSRSNSKNQVQPTWDPDGSDTPLLDHRLSRALSRNVSQQKVTADEYNTAAHMRHPANSIRPGEVSGPVGGLPEQGTGRAVRFSIQ